MVEAVLQYRVALPHQRGDGAQIGHITGGEQQCARAAGKFSQCLFNLMVRSAVANHQVRGTTPHTPALGAGLPGGDHLGVVGQAQVVIAAEGQQPLAVDHHFRPLRAFQQRPLPIQVCCAPFGQAHSQIESQSSLS